MTLTTYSGIIGYIFYINTIYSDLIVYNYSFKEIIMRDLSQIQADIDQVKVDLANVHGNEAEVYTRIVGYYRSVRNWNKGKRDEYNKRKLFELSCSRTQSAGSQTEYNTKQDMPQTHIVSIELFTKKTCPNCPAVIDFCKNLNVQLTTCSVETPENEQRAKEKAVRSAPTVICYDSDGKEVVRAYSVEDLQHIFVSEAIA